MAPKFDVEVSSAEQKQKKRKTLLNATWFQFQTFSTSKFDIEVWCAQQKNENKKHWKTRPNFSSKLLLQS